MYVSLFGYPVNLKFIGGYNMNKQEFEQLALRNNETISPAIYDSIERFYMSNNDYHAYHGGIEEDKQSFVKRVFNGKVNTPKTITKKLIAESIKSNRWCLQGHNKQRLDEMDRQITEHYTYIYEYNM